MEGLGGRWLGSQTWTWLKGWREWGARRGQPTYGPSRVLALSCQPLLSLPPSLSLLLSLYVIMYLPTLQLSLCNARQAGTHSLRACARHEQDGERESGRDNEWNWDIYGSGEHKVIERNIGGAEESASEYARVGEWEEGFIDWRIRLLFIMSSAERILSPL